MATGYRILSLEDESPFFILFRALCSVLCGLFSVLGYGI